MNREFFSIGEEQGSKTSGPQRYQRNKCRLIGVTPGAQQNKYRAFIIPLPVMAQLFFGTPFYLSFEKRRPVFGFYIEYTTVVPVTEFEIRVGRWNVVLILCSIAMSFLQQFIAAAGEKIFSCIVFKLFAAGKGAGCSK